MLNAVIYARFSSSAQREESIEDQLRECQEFADKEGLQVINTYCDYAISGKTDNRDQFQKMIKDAEQQLFQVVIIYKTDRFARNRWDSAIYKKRLKECGVKVIPAKEVIPDGPGGIILESIYEGWAEMYSVNLAENVRRGQHGNALKCKANCKAPFGYKINPQTRLYELDDTTAPIAEKVFTMAAEGKPTKDLQKFLLSNGIKKSASYIHYMLRNERYKGIYIFDGVRVEGGMPKLVSEDTFTKIAKTLKQRSIRPQANAAKYFLSLKLYCGYCGKLMSGEYGRSRNGYQYRYYTCPSSRRKKTCELKALPADKTENTIAEKLQATLLSDEIIDTMADYIIDYQRQVYENDSMEKALSKQLSDVEKRINNLLAAIEAGAMTDSTVNRLHDLEAKQKELLTSLSIEKLKAPIITKEKIVYYIKKYRDNDITVNEIRQEFLNTFVSKAYVFSDHLFVIYDAINGINTEVTPEILSNPNEFGYIPIWWN